MAANIKHKKPHISRNISGLQRAITMNRSRLFQALTLTVSLSALSSTSWATSDYEFNEECYDNENFVGDATECYQGEMSDGLEDSETVGDATETTLDSTHGYVESYDSTYGDEGADVPSQTEPVEDEVVSATDDVSLDPNDTVDTNDDDSDGWTNTEEEVAGSDPNDPNSTPVSDQDGDLIPDNLDDDRDGDGVNNNADNCPDHPNPDQADMDGDGVGDACDSDRDGDGISNTADNCPNHYNPDQADMDGDGVGNVCDPDIDGDGLPNEIDPDADGDGYNNDDDAFPYDPSEWSDIDGDGIGDNSDPDRDGDGIANEDDPSPDDLSAAHCPAP